MASIQEVGIASYDYVGRSEKELSFKKGQHVIIVQRLESGWWMGEIEGKRGHFPGNYIANIITTPASTTEGGSTPNIGGTTTLAQSASRLPPPPSLVTPPALALGAFRAGLKNLSSSTTSITAPTAVSAHPKVSPRATMSAYYPRRTNSTPIAKALALFDFTGDKDKKISFKRGESINVLNKLQEEGWWEGELNGQMGLFPSNYVKVVEIVGTTNPVAAPAMAPAASASPPTSLESSPEKSKDPSAQSIIAVCLYEFKTEDSSKLSFKKGDEVEVIKKASGSWWKGKMGNRVGYFPASYVRVQSGANNSAVSAPELSRSNSSSLRPVATAFAEAPLEETHEWLVALYDYSARNDSELSFTRGERIRLVEVLSENWYRGDKNGKVGRLPKNYVRLQNSEAAATAATVGSVDGAQQQHDYGLIINRNALFDPSPDPFQEQEEQEREAERAERERLEAEQMELAEKAQRLAREREERERIEQERLERERLEAVEKMERERIERERIERERQERERQEAAERMQRERYERMEREAKERAAREAQEKALREAQERAVREAQEKAAREAQEREAQERAERERRVREAALAAARPVPSVNQKPTSVVPAIQRPAQPRGRALPTPPPAPARGSQPQQQPAAVGGGGSSNLFMRGAPVPTAIPVNPQLRRVHQPSGQEAQELRAEVDAVRQWQVGSLAKEEPQEDESQLATTFEQLRALVLEERRERRRMAARLAAVEERLAQL